jgi:hypothetical protein
MAGGKGGGGGGGSKSSKPGKTVKKKVESNRPQYTMKIVESSVCAVCKTPCERGLRYLAKMSEPGAVGKGVPCILTRKRIN